MSRVNRLTLLILGPAISLIGVAAYVGSAAPGARRSAVALSMLMVVSSTVAGRAFFIWAQRAMLRRLETWKWQGRDLAIPAHRLGMVFGASVLGAALGPLVAQSLPGTSVLFLGMVGVMAFVSGWALAPDLMAKVRLELWQRKRPFSNRVS